MDILGHTLLCWSYFLRVLIPNMIVSDLLFPSHAFVRTALLLWLENFTTHANFSHENEKIIEKAIMNNSHANKLMQGLTTGDKKKIDLNSYKNDKQGMLGTPWV